MEHLVSDLLENISKEPLQITLFTITQQVTQREALYMLVEKILDNVQQRPDRIPVCASLIQLLRVSSAEDI
ncbi:hypothetical protein WJX74_007730 [Apatococcus lobatus]|uniref:Uncharacterized protein n=1 Tax=Apatococcus lobatus TaxID=904363 RepID=A0AAW1RSV0_9CHLO